MNHVDLDSWIWCGKIMKSVIPIGVNKLMALDIEALWYAKYITITLCNIYDKVSVNDNIDRHAQIMHVIATPFRCFYMKNSVYEHTLSLSCCSILLNHIWANFFSLSYTNTTLNRVEVNILTYQSHGFISIFLHSFN